MHTPPIPRILRFLVMGDDRVADVSAATLLDRMDLARDDPQIVQAILSILKAPDYPQLFSSSYIEDGQPPSEKTIKFVNALDKVCTVSPSCLVCYTELTPYTFRR